MAIKQKPLNKAQEKLFRLNVCRVEATKGIINTDIKIVLLLMLTLDKKLSFIQYLYFDRNNEAIKSAKKISILTLNIKGHWNCEIHWFLKFHKSRMKILVIVNFIEKHLTLKFAHIS